MNTAKLLHPSATGVGSMIEHLTRKGWAICSTHYMPGVVDGLPWQASTHRKPLAGEAPHRPVSSVGLSVHGDDEIVIVTVQAATLSGAFDALDRAVVEVDADMAGEGVAS